MLRVTSAPGSGAPCGRYLLAWAVLLAVSATWTAAEERPRVVLRAEATVTSRDVLLTDVADIAAPEELRVRLEQVSLGSGPVPGTQRIIKEDYVRLRLRRFGLDPVTLDFAGGPVRVTGGQAPDKRAPGGPSGPKPSEAVVAAESRAVAPLLVKRNQLVAVTVICGGVVVRATGRALSDGAADELIKVTLEDTHRTIIVRVAGTGEATCLLTRSTS